MALVVLKPSLAYLPAYADALWRDWSPDTTRPETAQDHLAEIARDPAAFVAHLDDPHPSETSRAGTVLLADGSRVARLPGFHRWLWDGEFCGRIGFRWQHGTTDLPPTCLGHIGFTVVPWKRRRGYATRALALLLPEARASGLAFVELTADPDNIVSQKVIRANGGAFIERFTKTDANGGGECLRFRILF